MTSSDLIDPLAGSGADRASKLRSDRGWLAEQWASETAQVVRVESGRVAVTGDGRSAEVSWRPAASVGRIPEGDWVLIGQGADGVTRFAIRASLDGGLGLRELGLAAGHQPDSHYAEMVTAVGVLNWHESAHWCPNCGSETALQEAGWMRRCLREGHKHFPRVDPAVIMLVADSDDRALLGSESRWPDKWFSTLAGFVEPGESFEEAVAREVLEEVGVVVNRFRYRASQPWPFPASTMIGFRAWTEGNPELRPDGRELSQARWFSRSQLSAACSSGEVALPPRPSISRLLIEDWYGSQLPNQWSR